jgi:phosphoribosylglycinamide formyltransferase-1
VGEERYAVALERALKDQSAEPAFKALLLAPPSENDLAVVSAQADPAAIHGAREALRTRMAAHLDAQLRDLHGRLQDAGPFSPDATQAGRRALRNAVIELMSANPTPYNRERARAHYDGAGNMTESIGGLAALMMIGGEAFEAALTAALEAAQIELVCLAGFMRLLTPWLVTRWTGRLLNIHPALLPAFRGLNTHERALAAGVKIHGATVHFVVPEVDSGPIVAQAAVPVRDDDTPETLAERVLAVELRLYPLALALVAGGKVSIAGDRTHGDAAITPAARLIVPDEM